MRYVIFAAVLTLALTGCTTVRTVDSTDAARFSEINKRAQGKKAHLTLASGHRIVASHLQVTRDSTSWFEPGTERLRTVATSQIAHVRFFDGGKGMVAGAWRGALSGAFFGVTLGMAAAGSSDNGFIQISAAQYILSGAIGFGILGIPIGAVLGSGNKTEYHFEASGASLSEAPARAASPAAQRTAPADSVSFTWEPASSPGLGSRRWTISAQLTHTSGGPGGDIERAMRAAGLDQRGPGFFGPGVDYPLSRNDGVGWVLGVHYALTPRWTAGVLLGESKSGETVGLGDSRLLTIDHAVTTVAPILSLQASKSIRFGVGPALHIAKVQETSVPAGPAERTRKVGFVVDLGVTVPAESRFFLDLKVQYHRVGGVSIGPYEMTSFHTGEVIAAFPETRVTYDHWSIGAGFGVRL